MLASFLLLSQDLPVFVSFLFFLFFPWKAKGWKGTFLCFSSSWRACCRLHSLHALWSNGGELMLSMVMNECRAFVFALKSLVTQFLLRFPERHWCVPIIVLDDIFIITIQVPIILSVLSNSYDEERASHKTWLQNDSAKLPCCVPTTGTCPGRRWLPSFSSDLGRSVQHFSVKASRKRITAYFVTIFSPPLSMHKSRVSHGYSNTKTFMRETQIGITVPRTQHKVLSKFSAVEWW